MSPKKGGGDVAVGLVPQLQNDRFREKMQVAAVVNPQMRSHKSSSPRLAHVATAVEGVSQIE